MLASSFEGSLSNEGGKMYRVYFLLKNKPGTFFWSGRLATISLAVAKN
jgi:hypothetical protein